MTHDIRAAVSAKLARSTPLLAVVGLPTVPFV